MEQGDIVLRSGMPPGSVSATQRARERYEEALQLACSGRVTPALLSAIEQRLTRLTKA